jgi:hypothetical protein
MMRKSQPDVSSMGLLYLRRAVFRYPRTQTSTPFDMLQVSETGTRNKQEYSETRHERWTR